MKFTEELKTILERIIEEFGISQFLLSFVLGAIVWVLLTPVRLARIHADELAIHRWICLILCCALCGLIFRGTSFALDKTRSYLRERDIRRVKRRLRRLSIPQQMILRKFKEERSQSVVIKKDNFTNDLCRQGILFERGSHQDGDIAGFSITNLTYEALCTHEAIFEGTFPTEIPHEREWWQ